MQLILGSMCCTVRLVITEPSGRYLHDQMPTVWQIMVIKEKICLFLHKYLYLYLFLCINLCKRTSDVPQTWQSKAIAAPSFVLLEI